MTTVECLVKWYRPMPGSSMLRTQHAAASESGIAGMARCSGPCSSPPVALVGAVDDDCGIVSIRGGSLICTVRLDVDEVRPTTECSLGSDSRLLSPPAAAADELDEPGWTTRPPSPGIRPVTSVCDVICSNQRRDRCVPDLRNIKQNRRNKPSRQPSKTRQQQRIIETDV